MDIGFLFFAILDQRYDIFLKFFLLSPVPILGSLDLTNENTDCPVEYQAKKKKKV